MLRFARRINWSREEWIIAYDACPKDFQSYGPEDAFVRELADLLGRTPAAVSRAFGNLWAAQTGGRHGLVHRSHVAEEVVAEFRDDLPRLHAVAQELRLARIPSSLTPRIEMKSSTSESPLPEDTVHESARIAGLDPRFYFVTSRPGSTVVDVGILLDVLLIGFGAWDAVLRTIQFVRDRARDRERASPENTIVVKNRIWRDIEAGRTKEVEERILAVYLPGISTSRLDRDSHSRLTGFFSFVRGVRQRPSPRSSRLVATDRATVGRPFTRATLERILGVDLSGLSDAAIKQLSDLVKVAKTTEFTAALRATRRAWRRKRKDK